MLRLTGPHPWDPCTRRGPLRAGLVSLSCLVRGLPLCLCAAPGTPLRVLCLVALDTVHVLRHGRPLTRQRRRELAMFLDFQACTNAAWDRKPLCAADYQALRARLATAGLGSWITEYFRRLRELETRRPPVGGDRHRFDDVRSYREAVARLSLATITAIALNAECLEEGLRATYGDDDVATLFHLAMQCQIIDDVVDYGTDLAAGLPSFLTACASLPQALVWTGEAAQSYGRTRGAFPLQVALHAVTAVTKLVVGIARSTESRHALAAHDRRP